jgi:hypothetical protein
MIRGSITPMSRYAGTDWSDFTWIRSGSRVPRTEVKKKNKSYCKSKYLRKLFLLHGRGR